MSRFGNTSGFFIGELLGVVFLFADSSSRSRSSRDPRSVHQHRAAVARPGGDRLTTEPRYQAIGSRLPSGPTTRSDGVRTTTMAAGNASRQSAPADREVSVLLWTMHLPRPHVGARSPRRPTGPSRRLPSQAFTASYASDALSCRFLLRLGAAAALVVVVGATPVAGAALQAFAPQILRRLEGNLRGSRGLALAESAASSSPRSWPVWRRRRERAHGDRLISVTVAVGQTAGVLSGSTSP